MWKHKLIIYRDDVWYKNIGYWAVFIWIIAGIFSAEKISWDWLGISLQIIVLISFAVNFMVFKLFSAVSVGHLYLTFKARNGSLRMKKKHISGFWTKDSWLYIERINRIDGFDFSSISPERFDQLVDLLDKQLEAPMIPPRPLADS
jgi:hypothetical protein